MGLQGREDAYTQKPLPCVCVLGGQVGEMWGWGVGVGCGGCVVWGPVMNMFKYVITFWLITHLDQIVNSSYLLPVYFPSLCDTTLSARYIPINMFLYVITLQLITHLDQMINSSHLLPMYFTSLFVWYSSEHQVHTNELLVSSAVALRYILWNKVP